MKCLLTSVVALAVGAVELRLCPARIRSLEYELIKWYVTKSDSLDKVVR